MPTPALLNTTTAIWTTGSSVVLTIPAVSAGSLIVVLGSNATTTPFISSVSMTGGTFAAAGTSNAVRYATIWRAYNVSAGATTLTVNLSGTPTTFSVVVLEFSNVGAGADSAATAANGNSTTMASASITPTSGRAGVVVAWARGSGAISAGPTGGFTATSTPDTRSVGGYLLEPLTSGGSYSTSWTVGSGTWECEIVAFLAPAAASSVPIAAMVSALGIV